jgi:hypothetical protein
MEWLTKYLPMNRKIRERRIEDFVSWYVKELFKIDYKINPDIKLTTLYHLLLFIIEDGDICYFSNENTEISKKILNNENNINKYNYFKQKLGKQNIHDGFKNSFNYDLIYSLAIGVRKYYANIIECEKIWKEPSFINKDDELEMIRLETRVLIDNSEISNEYKKSQMKVLEAKYVNIKNMKNISDEQFNIITHNYNMFIK